MNNRENKIDKKYYLVSLSDGTKSMVSDEVVNLKLAFNQLLQVHAIEENGELRTLIGNMKILDVNKSYNPNIFDIRNFVEGNYSLFGVKKVEISSKKMENEIITKYNTPTKVKKAYEEIVSIENKTKEEANRQYVELLEAYKSFTEEVNKGRVK